LPDELVVVRRFRDLFEAELAKGKLASAGIDCVIADKNTVRMDWLWSNAIGGMRLLVKLEDADTARNLLDEPIPDQIVEEDSNVTYTQPRCPKCDSLDVSFETLDRQLSYTLLFLNVAFPFTKHNWKCQNCGAEWVDESEKRAEEQI